MQHVVEAGEARRDALVGDDVGQLGRPAMRELETRGVEGDGELVAREARAAVLDDAQVPEGRAVDHLVAQHDDAVDHELHEAVALVGVGAGHLLGDDGAEAGAHEPVAQAIHLAPLGAAVVEQAQQHVDAVEDDALGVDGLGLGLEDGQHAQQIEVAATPRRERGGRRGRRASSSRAPAGPSRRSRRWR
ncbi:MAG: hypothetical protein U1F43_33310 [Myxococcota bacterium]